MVVHDDRVDVHLPQLRQHAHHVAHTQQQVLQGFVVGRRRAAPLAQHLVGA
jgi:hypothetical protein